MNMQNPLGRAARRDDASESTATPELEPGVERSFLDEPNETKASESEPYTAGSWLSHAAFGLGAVAFVSPLLIPGIPIKSVFVVYCAISLAGMVALMLWGVIDASLEGRRERRRQRRKTGYR